MSSQSKLYLYVADFCKDHELTLQKELKFHPTRRWRFDITIPELMVAIEYEGIHSKKSRHTSIKGYTSDVEKYNQATLLGWKLLRYTASNCKAVVDHLETILLQQ